MLENYVADKGATRPCNPLVAAALSEVESRGLRGKDSQVDSCLLCRRRLAAKNGVKFDAPRSRSWRVVTASATLLAASSDTSTMNTLRSKRRDCALFATVFGLGASGFSWASESEQSNRLTRTTVVNRRMVNAPESMNHL